MTKSGGRQNKSLKHGRPPLSRTGAPRLAMSAKATRTLIRSHHELERALAKAERQGDDDKITTVKKKLEQQGGLELYQQASLQGQSRDRGGDTSRLLLDWLRPDLDRLDKGRKLRMLEIGALSTKNQCSRSPRLNVSRIDLHAQEPGILHQDFMKRPLPTCKDERFDIISLSLVLNYVPTPEGRGEMLRRTVDFMLEPCAAMATDKPAPSESRLPALFLVLPAPCVTNSRYLDESGLNNIMTLLGYKVSQRKCSPKLISFLYTWNGSEEVQERHKVVKKEVSPGAKRNNFCIVLG